MSKRFALVWVWAVVATAFPGIAAAAIVVDPLLVVVETAPGADVEPVEVRRAIAGELGAPVRAPRDSAAPDTSDLLIVAVDQAEIRMSLRARAAGVVSRAVPAPGDRKARLQSIRWLAGNLARDQVSAIVVAEPAPAPVSPAYVEVRPAASPPAAPSPHTEPPPLAETAIHEPTGASKATVSTQPSPSTSAAGPFWSVTLAGGPTAFYTSPTREEPIWPGPGLYYLEVQRRPSPDGLFFGAALDVGPDMALFGGGTGADLIAATALVGVGHRFGRTSNADGRHERGRPIRAIPPAVDEAPPFAADADDERAAYARAHRAHFVDDAPARALADWDAYLASYPAGAFAPEAAYNRALCLARLGRFAQATAALRPFARGRFGAYRREEAALLLDWLATKTAR